MNVSDNSEAFVVRRNRTIGWILEMIVAAAILIYFSTVLGMMIRRGELFNIPTLLLFAILLGLWTLSVLVIVRNLKCFFIDETGISLNIIGFEIWHTDWVDIVNVKSHKKVVASVLLFLSSSRHDASFCDRRGRWRSWDREWTNGERLWKLVLWHVHPEKREEARKRKSQARAIERKHTRLPQEEELSGSDECSSIPVAKEHRSRKLAPDFDTARSIKSIVIVPIEGMIFPQICCRCLRRTNDFISIVLHSSEISDSAAFLSRLIGIDVPCCKSCEIHLEGKDGRGLTGVLGLIGSGTAACMSLFLSWGSFNVGWLIFILSIVGIVWSFRSILQQEDRSAWIRVIDVDLRLGQAQLSFGSRRFVSMVKKVLAAS